MTSRPSTTISGGSIPLWSTIFASTRWRRLTATTTGADRQLRRSARCPATGRIDSAPAYCREALELARRGGLRQAIGLNLNNIGTAYRDLGRLNSALAILTASLAIRREVSDSLGESITLNNIAQAEQSLGRPDSAIIFLRGGTSMAWYDNSASNTHNPDATKDVKWGDQTWEEMQDTGFLYSVPSQRLKPAGELR